MATRYEDYNAPDFALDPSFQGWVLDDDPQARAFWLDWLERHPGKRETLEEARQLLNTLNFRPHAVPEGLLSTMWNNIQAANKTTQPGTPSVPETIPLSPARPAPAHPFRQWQRLAAVLVGILVVSAAVWLAVTSRATTRYETVAGEIRRIQLPDSTWVVLNGTSSLRLGRQWRHDQPREVWLDGEAFFEVAHAVTPANRFHVHADGLDVEVLGTAFNVWDRGAQTKVVLETGAVRLTGASLARPLAMQPGEMVALRAGDGRVEHRRVDVGLYTSWREKRLVFNGTPIREVAEVIQTRYGYRVDIPDSTLNREQITFRSDDDDFALLLRLLSETFRVEWNEAKKQLIIRELPAKP